MKRTVSLPDRVVGGEIIWNTNRHFHVLEVVCGTELLKLKVFTK